MITDIVILWILIHLNAPAWCYVLLGVEFFAEVLTAILKK